MKMNKLYLNLDGEWYDLIASRRPEPETGKPKTIEYRAFNEYWFTRIYNAIFNYQGRKSGGKLDLRHARKLFPGKPSHVLAVFRHGYSNTKMDILRKVTLIDIGPCPYAKSNPKWKGDFFRIHFALEDFHEDEL